jgi:Domain of unknown function (DUF3850)
MGEPLTENPRVHELKTWPEFFDRLIDGSKNFEIRKNDRGYRVGDRLRLQEFVPCENCGGTGLVRRYTELDDCFCKYTENKRGRYTGREVGRVVTYVTDFQQKPGVVVMGVRG